jgi:hypothetical protein
MRPGSNQIFVYAKLGRFRLGNCYLFGSGLGNTLFAWARSEVAAEYYGLPVIPPVWRRLTSGGGWITAVKAFRTSNSTARTYAGLFLEPAGIGSIGNNLLTLACATHLDEDALPRALERAKHYLRPVVFVFSDVRNRFLPLANHQRHLANRFSAILAPRVAKQLATQAEPRFACHVRLGDFNPESESNPLTATNARLPMAWYIEQVKKISTIWPGIPIDLFSDGTDDEVLDLLRLPAVSRANHGNAVADLMAMSRARMLICSGSTYSAWAAFLGGMPTIWFPGKLQSQFGDVSLPHSIEMAGSDSIPDSFRRVVRTSPQ